MFQCSRRFAVAMAKFLFFLQKRSKTATRLPDYFGFWGGGIDAGETPEQCLEREIKEELNIEIESYTFLGRYEFLRKIAFVFYKEMDDGFESKITILEGDYGKWFSQQDIEKEPFLIHEDKTILLDIFNKTRL